MSAHSETPVDSAQELDELTRLRVELSYADWKAHPRHRTERVMRDAQRRWGVPEREARGLLAPVVPRLRPRPDEE